jgi:hypothetical protein
MRQDPEDGRRLNCRNCRRGSQRRNSDKMGIPEQYARETGEAVTTSWAVHLVEGRQLVSKLVAQRTEYQVGVL